MQIHDQDSRLELHELRAGDGLALLLLHPLYSCSASLRDELGDVLLAHWTGPVFALDFSGHGRSSWRRGGWYSAEHFAGDADLALNHVGRAALLGSGLGAYVSLLLAGARPAEVAGALLLPGEGLCAAGPEPAFDVAPDPWAGVALGDTPARSVRGECDPMLCCVEHEVRPPDYARDFARAARNIQLFEESFEDAGELPPWWIGLRELENVEVTRGALPRAIAAWQQALRATAA